MLVPLLEMTASAKEKGGEKEKKKKEKGGERRSTCRPRLL